ncbi:MAG: hypothetical protein JWP89_4678 [Schlesneria sp.]|nr:hypothetical protein [Schlesneria sp.]
MNPEMTFCFYLLIGIGVAAALWLRSDSRSKATDLFQILSAPFFWPIYLPILLASRSDSFASVTSPLPAVGSTRMNDAMALAITQVERELDAALQSLNGWAENVLAEERLHIAELKSAWRQQANHIRELDKLLAQTLIEPPAIALQASAVMQPIETPSPSTTSAAGEQPAAAVLEEQATHSRSAEHEKIRAENITRLKQLRRSMLDDLMATVAWVRELVTMIHLAKYTGAPASRAHELVKQIASAVKGYQKSIA